MECHWTTERTKGPIPGHHSVECSAPAAHEVHVRGRISALTYLVFLRADQPAMDNGSAHKQLRNRYGGLDVPNASTHLAAASMTVPEERSDTSPRSKRFRPLEASQLPYRRL
jgi:hypothetical protein